MPVPTQPGPSGTLLAQAQYDFAGTENSQLSLSMGDYLYVNATDPLGEDDDEDWIYVRQVATGAEGFVPSTFLKEVPRELIEIEKISAELRNMARLQEVEEKLRQGFEEVLANPTLSKPNRVVLETKLSDCELRLVEIEARMKHFQDILINLTSGHADNEDDEEDDEDEDDETAEKPAPIPVFTGIIKPILRKPNVAYPKKKLRFSADVLENLSDAEKFVLADKETALYGGGDGGTADAAAASSTSTGTSTSEDSPLQPTAETKSPTEKPPSTKRSTGKSAGIKIFGSGGKKDARRPSLSGPPEQVEIPAADIKGASITGTLWVDSNSNLKSWSRRFLVLKNSVLYIYKKASDKEPCDKLVLPSYAISPLYDKNKHWAFRASHAGMATKMFAADDKVEFAKWMNAMSLATIVEEKDMQQPAYRRKRESLQEGLALRSFKDLVDKFEGHDKQDADSKSAPIPLTPIAAAAAAEAAAVSFSSEVGGAANCEAAGPSDASKTPIAI